MTAEWIKEISNWEKEYPTLEGVNVSKREKEILDGSPLKSHGGMVFGRMYSDWKKRKGYGIEETV